MLPLAAIALLAAAQATPTAPEPLPPDMVPRDEPAPPPGKPGATAQGTAQPERAEPPGSAPGGTKALPLPSLFAAEPLTGRSLATAWAGWASLGIAYAQGVSKRDDLGATLDFDWAKTELRLGGLYRRKLGTAGDFAMMGRLGLAWYANFGGQWIEEDNRDDRGIELSPGLAFSRPAGGGVLSLLGDLPITVTVRRGSGILFIPRFSVVYETPLWEEITVGVKAGVAYRAGSGDAPLPEGHGEVQFLVVASYRL